MEKAQKATGSSYERGVAEVFGYVAHSSSPEAVEAVGEYRCPFLGSRCVKPSQHRGYDPNIPFGACSVWHRGKGILERQPYVICPIRFVQDRQIFLDASKLLESHENTEIVVVPEVGLAIGRIDYIIARYGARARTVTDFLVLEVMACSTTSTGDILRSFHNVLQGRTTEKRLKYGINYRQVLSRMMVQVLAKAYACEKWGVPMVWAIQDVLFTYMRTTTRVDLERISVSTIDSSSTQMPILFFVYGMGRDESRQRFQLGLREIYGGTKESFARILEPQGLLESSAMVELIQEKIQTKRAAFTLDVPLADALAKVAPEIVEEASSFDE